MDKRFKWTPVGVAIVVVLGLVLLAIAFPVCPWEGHSEVPVHLRAGSFGEGMFLRADGTSCVLQSQLPAGGHPLYRLGTLGDWSAWSSARFGASSLTGSSARSDNAKAKSRSMPTSAIGIFQRNR